VTTLTGKFKFLPKDIIASGTFFPKGRDLVDRFAGRVIFPLFDHRDKVLGFAGRLLPWEDTGRTGKYINSPETPLYHKSANLYGLNFTREETKKAKLAVVVEGELDLISSFYAGVTNIVAIKGTAITHEHAQLLKRFCDKVVFFLDSDAAGNMATKRGIVEAYKTGLEISVATLSSFKDPDEAARNNPVLLQESITHAKNVWDYFVDSAFDKHDSTTASGKLALSRELIPIIASIPDKILEAHYVELFAKKLGIPATSVYQELSKASPFITTEKKEEPEPVKKEEMPVKENWLFTLALFFDHSFFADSANAVYFSNHAAQRLFAELCKIDVAKTEFQTIHEQLPAELRELFSDLVLSDVSAMEATFKKEMAQMKVEIMEHKRQEERKELSLKIAELEEKDGDVSALTQKYSDLTKKH